MNREATGLAGVRHITYDTLGSTNAEALTRARAGECGPLWITAQSQYSIEAAARRGASVPVEASWLRPNARKRVDCGD